MLFPRMTEAVLTTLKKQIAKYDAALTEFLSVECELRLRSDSARVADMRRINRETINAMERSLELVRMRLAAAIVAQPEYQGLAAMSASPGAGK